MPTATKLKSHRVHSHIINDGFNTTDEFRILQCANVDGNNNKFYSCELQVETSTGHYRIFTNYGRLGEEGVYEVRDLDTLGNPLSDKEMVKKEMGKLLAKKKRGKKAKRPDGSVVHEHYEELEILVPSVGSSNIRGRGKVEAQAPTIISRTKHDPSTNRVLQLFVRENIHSITGATSIKFTSGGFETPLGVVSDHHIDRAEKYLNTIRLQLMANDSGDTYRETLNAYFSLIPRKIGRSWNMSDWIDTPDKLAAEYDLLETLRTSVNLGIKSEEDTSDIPINISPISIDRRLNNYFEETKHRRHSHLAKYRIANMWEVNIPKVREKYNKCDIGNIRELFHGSRCKNMLSIISGGLIIPPESAGHVTGRAFGDGIYGADRSTKALNYATGYWSSSGHRDLKSAFVLIVTFKMGREYKASQATHNAPDRSKYDSTHAISEEQGGVLLNAEYIVYEREKCDITHMLELTY